jgi:hypothetical protein
MAENIILSKDQPELESMRFDFLREEGIKHIERLSGKLWTDFNLSDPGVTILEVLSYAITDLGYRTTYNVPDILAQNPNNPKKDLKNFYTAAEILPMSAVTFKDYRKLLIDIEINTPEDLVCPVAGVKNAWIQLSQTNEIPIYTDFSQDILRYTPSNLNQDPLKLKPLYNVLLEFDSCDELGDLNANTIERKIQLYACADILDFDAALSGTIVNVSVEFPRWDDPQTDWESNVSIRSGAANLILNFEDLPSGYRVDGYGLTANKEVWLSITKGNQPIGALCIAHQLDELLFNPQNEQSFSSLYQRKVQKVFEIVKAVREKLMANRNLCEDFYQINALKVEEILMCGDFVLSTDADIEEVEAKIYYAVRNFLSPTVYFYSLEEMYAKGYQTEEIFEGPLLTHGFIDDKELDTSGIRSSIHVSDIISIIMDIPGVEAVRNLQIANIPLNNTDGILSQSVKWCLHLAFDKNYIPRLSINKSNLTFLKEEIPYQSNREETDVLLEELIAGERPQKLYNTPLNIPVPEGNFRDLSDYQSIQEDFPLLYGIGSEGLPAGVSEQRKAQTKQLKGFLLIFDQLFADYLAQLANIGSLFSMNGVRGADGEFIIDKSYFTQSLESVVPGIEDLLVDPVNYAEDLQNMAEGENGFNERRNRFLNHLMARFGEQFTDYALLVYKLTGKKTPEELLVDKLNFLNQYPAISSGRFKAFNYESPCDIWSIQNISGLERRTSLLSGIDTSEGVTLSFSEDYSILEISPSLFQFEVLLPNYIVYSVGSFAEQSLAMEQIEKLIVNGVSEENYSIGEDNGSYFIYVTCRSGNRIARSAAFVSEPTQSQFEDFVGEAVAEFSRQYYENPESNRANLIAPLLNYFEVDTVIADMISDPPKYLMEYTLNYYTAGTTDNFELINGPYIGYGKCKSSAGILAIDPVNDQITMNGNLLEFLQAGDAVLIDDSQNNDGNYEVESVTLDEPVPGEFRTIITLANDPLLVDSYPYGVLLYNKQTEQMLIDEGVSQIDQNIFDIASRGLLRSNYTFSEYDPLIPGSYRFQIINKCNDVIATSVDSNFNEDIASAIYAPNGIDPATIAIVNSSGNNGGYTVDTTLGSTVAQGALIKIEVNEPIPNLIGDGQLVFKEKGFTINAVNKFDHFLVLDGINLASRLFIGDQFSIYDSAENDGLYTVQDILYNPVSNQTTIWVVETISDDELDLGFIEYAKSLEVIEVQAGSNAFIVKGGADEFAVQQLMAYFRKRFFSHEGMHLVEHILLRPKVREELFLPFGPSVPPLDNNWNIFGMVSLGKELDITELNITENELVVPGDFTADFIPIQEVSITGSQNGLLDGTYHLISTYFDGTDTTLKMYEPLPEVTLTDYGKLQYRSTVPITDIPGSVLVIAAIEVSFVNQDVPIIISGSENGINDGEYRIASMVAAGTDTMMTVDARKVIVEDDLLSVNLGDDCDACIVDDPYSFVLTAIMPAWQGRFSNQDFRAFFNRQFRLECPAHLVPSICWVSNEQMEQFEKAWKKWLIENQKKNKNKVELSRSLSEVINVLKNLRSVYPQGTLHDCEISDSLEKNTIILNRTSLGTN